MPALIREIQEIPGHLEAKVILFSLLERGEAVVLCRRNVPIAEIRPWPRRRTRRRPVGLARGTFKGPPSFFEPLPDWLLDAFERRTS